MSHRVARTAWIVVTCGWLSLAAREASGQGAAAVGTGLPTTALSLGSAPAIIAADRGVTLTLGARGCAWTQFELRAGTSPGASDLGAFTTGSLQVAYPGVPNGLYYVRARARNASGTSGGHSSCRCASHPAV